MWKKANLLALALSVVTAPTLAADVWTVSTGPGADFACLRDAVQAAQDGDTVLIQPGDYPCTTVTVDGKGLNLVVDGGGEATGSGSLVVRNLGAEQVLSTSGIRGRVVVEQCAGEVLLHNAGTYETMGVLLGDLQVFASASVTLVDCSFQGAAGMPWTGQDGLDGARVIDSGVTLYRTTLAGGAGAQQICHLGEPGDGGSGLVAEGNSQVRAVESDLVPGAGGVVSGCAPGHSGAAVELLAGATLETSTHPELRVNAPTLVREGQPYSLSIEGPGVVRARLLASSALGIRRLPPQVGVLHLGKPFEGQPLGAVPPSGFLRVPMTAPVLQPGEEARLAFVQVAAFDGQGFSISNVWPITFVVASY